MSSNPDIETSLTFTPAFDEAGLLPAIVTDAEHGGVLMFAFMNREALDLTLSTRIAHFYSRSRQRLWKKGEESGNILDVVEIRTDCDQDAVWLSVSIRGTGVACHTGETSCFYRRVDLVTPQPRAAKLLKDN